MATVVAAAALILGVPVASDAHQVAGVEIAFANGRVSVAVEQATARQVLAEWSRIGRTEIVGAELADKRIVTGLKLADVSEGEALEAILGKSFGFVQLVRGPQSGLSSTSRLVIGAALPAENDEKAKVQRNSSLPPEARFDYYVPDKAAEGEDFGKPVYEKLEVPAPETRFDYFQPQKMSGDYGMPVPSPIDPHWQIPEKTFEYFSKEFTKVYAVEPPKPAPTTYPEVRFKYYTPPKD